MPYADFPRFQEVMAEDSGQSVLPALLEQILPLAPELPARLEVGIDVLDVGCGAGRALNLMAAAYPRSRFRGVDLSEGGIAAGQAEAEERGLQNLSFEARDATTLDDEEQFDLIMTFDAVHDQARPDLLLQAIRRALRADGVYLMQEIDASSEVAGNLEHPIGPFLYTVSTMHCMTVSLAEGGFGLGTMWGVETAQTMLAEAGFRRVEVERLSHDIQNAYFVSRP